MIDLVKSKVQFEPIGHTYELEGKNLSGVTSLLARQLFPTKYSGIPQFVLDNAKERGSMIHETIEVCDTLGDFENDNEEYRSYRRLLKEEGLERVENEYTVSDNDMLASQIDLVAKDGEERIALADFKTTSHLDEEYVSWQLSIYAYLFELQNPSLKVRRLYAIWLPLPQYGKAKIVEVSRKADSEIAKLIACDKAGEQYEAPKSEGVIVVGSAEQAYIRDLLESYKELDNKVSEMKAGLLSKMEEYNVKKFECDSFVLTRKLAGKVKTFNKKRFQEAYPDLYEQFVEESETKESIAIRVRNN